jgi:hypothetical protein
LIQYEAVPKFQFLEQKLMKIAVLQPVGRKTARAGSKTTNFGTGLYDNDFTNLRFARLRAN